MHAYILSSSHGHFITRLYHIHGSVMKGPLPLDSHAFARDGYALLSDVLDPEGDLLAVRRGIYEIINYVRIMYGLAPMGSLLSPDCFDDGLIEIAHHDRAAAGLVYDHIKGLPAFQRLAASSLWEQAMSVLRPGSVPALVEAGQGIRMDIPGETAYLAPWHQEYPTHLSSPDGLIMWIPLRDMTSELGPLEVLPGSHQEGILPLFTPEGKMRSDLYAWQIHKVDDLIMRYPSFQPLPHLGDVIILDFLTVHRSGVNHTKRPRWSIQIRYFNLNNPVGQAMGWPSRLNSCSEPAFPGLYPHLFFDSKE